MKKDIISMLGQTEIGFTTKFLDMAKKKGDGTPKPIWLFPVDDRLNTKAQVQRLKAIIIQIDGCDNPDAKAFQLAVTIGDPIMLEESDAVTLITVVQSMNIVLPHLIEEHASASSTGEDHTGSTDSVDTSVKTPTSKPKSKQSK